MNNYRYGTPFVGSDVIACVGESGGGFGARLKYVQSEEGLTIYLDEGNATSLEDLLYDHKTSDRPAIDWSTHRGPPRVELCFPNLQTLEVVLSPRAIIEGVEKGGKGSKAYGSPYIRLMATLLSAACSPKLTTTAISVDYRAEWYIHRRWRTDAYYCANRIAFHAMNRSSLRLLCYNSPQPRSTRDRALEDIAATKCSGIVLYRNGVLWLKESAMPLGGGVVFHESLQALTGSTSRYDTVFAPPSRREMRENETPQWRWWLMETDPCEPLERGETGVDTFRTRMKRLENLWECEKSFKLYVDSGRNEAIGNDIKSLSLPYIENLIVYIDPRFPRSITEGRLATYMTWRATQPSWEWSVDRTIEECWGLKDENPRAFGPGYEPYFSSLASAKAAPCLRALEIYQATPKGELDQALWGAGASRCGALLVKCALENDSVKQIEYHANGFGPLETIASELRMRQDCRLHLYDCFAWTDEAEAEFATATLYPRLRSMGNNVVFYFNKK